jgi:hypothetical protein
MMGFLRLAIVSLLGLPGAIAVLAKDFTFLVRIVYIALYAVYS